MSYRLSDICSYRKGKVEVSSLTSENYISTENMLPNKGGITYATSLPTVALHKNTKKAMFLCLISDLISKRFGELNMMVDVLTMS